MKKHIKWKILIPTLLIYVSSIIIILAVVLYMASTSIDGLSNDFLAEKNQSYSTGVQVSIDQSMRTARSLQPSFLSDVIHNSGDRDGVISALTKVISDDPDVFGIYTLWEPNAFDGKDSEYIGKPGGDETGRFNVYIYRGASGLDQEPLKGFDIEGEGDYYLIPQRTKTDSVIDPYAYDTGSETVYIVSMVTPIVIDGEFLGIVGTDILVDSLVSELGKVTLFETGYLFATDSGGTIVQHPDRSYMGNSIFDHLDNTEKELVAQALSSGNSISTDTYINGNKQKIRLSVNPVSISGAHWLVGSIVPVSEINAVATRIFLYGGGIGITAVIIITAVLLMLTDNIISRPINRLMNLITEVTKGNLDIDMDKTNISQDETGVLTLRLYSLVDILHLLIKEMAAMGDGFAKGDIDASINLSHFQGSYRTVAEGVNNMVSSVVNDILLFMDCLKEVGNGNFNADIPLFPGKKALMNDNLNNIRNNLTSISREISSLVDATASGQLSSRADVDKYKGGWAVLLESLNQLVEAIVAPIHEAATVLEQVSLGNFDKKMEGSYQGDFLIIKSSINNTVINVASYIDEISEVLNALSHNNLNKDITREYVGKFSNIKDALNDIIDKFNIVISDIFIASDQVAAAAKQISESADILAQGATEQASSVEELNATVFMINENTVQNAESAKSAEVLSDNSMKSAAVGNDEMDNMLSSIKGIKDSSNSISSIIKVIDDIAFQTNLLALNAAVEAARAGEQGKGFAIVAEEVRSLAGKSQAAAQETTDLIEESIDRVNQGTGIADKTSNAFQTIVGDASKVADIIVNISQSSKQQEVSIAQIKEGVSQIVDVLQKNTSSSEEVASASQELSNQAELLRNLVSVFELKK